MTKKDKAKLMVESSNFESIGHLTCSFKASDVPINL
jgi:hypothetical protein